MAECRVCGKKTRGRPGKDGKATCKSCNGEINADKKDETERNAE